AEAGRAEAATQTRAIKNNINPEHFFFPVFSGKCFAIIPLHNFRHQSGFSPLLHAFLSCQRH
ncbi:MAG: hypothetical protein U9P80_00240, partial [Thermodesulfobacteriota bacterium]|nr:hypothetical protein [Thermodesulfobacteriota bacterium]